MKRARIRTKAVFGWLAAVAVFVAAPHALPQTPPGQEKAIPLSKVERKNRAPISKEVLRVKLPRPVETTLDNGLTVLVMEDRRLPSVSVQFTIASAGPLHDPAGLPGLANVTAQLMREGTRTRTSRQIAEEIDGLGATLSVFSGFGSTDATLNASGLSDNLDEWFALALDVLLNPSFPPDELDKLRQRLKTQLRQNRSSPFFLAQERFSRAVFREHPAAVVATTPEALDAMKPEDIAKWHRERYVPQNALLGIAGDVPASELVAKLRRWLAGWQRSDLRETLPTHPAPLAVRKVYLVDRPGSVQTSIRIGNIALDRRHADYVPLVVVNRILGSGPSARLFLNIREEKGYAYTVGSFFTAVKYPGPWLATAEVRSEVTEPAITEMLNEIRRIREQPVSEADLEEEKRSVVAAFALSLEQPIQLLNYAVTRKIYGFPDDYWDTYPAKIVAVTADEVQRVAQKYLNPDTLQIVAVGDRKTIQAALEKFGPLEVYDSDGRPAAVKTDSGSR